MATDSVSGNASVASVTIHLRDINDHRPTFPHSMYNLSVYEHSAVGYVVTDSIQVSERGWGGLGWESRGDGQAWGCPCQSLCIVWGHRVPASAHVHVSVRG